MDAEKALKTLNVKSVWLPVAIGLGIVTTLIITDDRITADSLALIRDISPFALILSLLILTFKDAFNIFRLKSIARQELSWGSVFRVIMLWEFAIAVTPPFVGATAVLVFIMFKEGLSFGKALAYTLLLAIFDNLFFLTASPLAIWWSNGQVIPDQVQVVAGLEQGIAPVFWLSYSLVGLYTAFMLSAVLFFPKAIRRVTNFLFSHRWLDRWKTVVMKQADDLVLVSQILKGKPIYFWFSILGLAYVVWVLKFALLNVLISGFVEVSWGDQVLLLGRHLIMWIVLLVSPAPGNAGAAELIFPVFFEEYLREYTFICALLWRLISYYPYLLIGAFVLPKWIRTSKA